MIWDLQKYADNIALIQEGTSYSYAFLSRESERIASFIKPRSLVFCLCRNTLASICGYVAFLNNGIVPLLVDSKLDDDLANRLIDLYRPAYYWLPEEMVDRFSSAGEVLHSFEGYCLMASGLDAHPVNDSLSLLVSTSGSTGSPKLVRLSEKNIVSNTESIISYLEIDENERAITSLPMNYVYGLSVINTHLYAGATLVLTEFACHTKQFWQVFNEHQVSSFAGVPFMYEMLDKLGFVKSMDVPSLRTMTQAGGKLSGTLQKKFVEYARSTNRKFVIMYGASEATARMGYLPFDSALEKENSMGVAIPGGRLEIIDADGNPIVEPGEVGELIYYGDNVSLGYAQEGADLAKGDENCGRLETGDMARVDEDGFFFIVGRKKRFIKMLGKRTNLDELDGLLKERFNTNDIVCSGEDDKLRIFVTDNELKGPIVDYVFKSIGINRNLFKVICIEAIPRNESGKILFSALAKL